MVIRKATIADAKNIHRLIEYWAKRGKVLPRSLNYIYENIRDFWVVYTRKKLMGCCALHVVGWDHLGEIKSLVVDEHFARQGTGKKLVEECLDEAKKLGIKNVFVLTFVPRFFEKLSFRRIKRASLPHKIWSDCVHCIYFPDCKEEAVICQVK